MDGPRVRLGVAWAAASLLAVLVGPLALALAMASVALGAAGQAARSWRRARRRPYRPVAVGGAVVCALAGAGGPIAVGAAAALTAVAAYVATQLQVGGRSWDVQVTLAIALLCGMGAAAPVVMRTELGLIPALVFVVLVHAFDASSFIVGSAGRRWEGAVAGLAAVLAVALGVAGVFVPPFRGASPWILAVLVALGVPAGTLVATAVVGRAEAPVPALRRLDGFLVVGPVWIVLARLLLDL